MEKLLFPSFPLQPPHVGFIRGSPPWLLMRTMFRDNHGVCQRRVTPCGTPYVLLRSLDVEATLVWIAAHKP